MVRFDKIVVGLAERILSVKDCTHQSEYPTSVPCPRCIDAERAANQQLLEAVSQEGDRRFLLKLRRQGRFPRPAS